MWLKSKSLAVYFDKNWGGMPMKDNRGILKCASIEYARTRKKLFHNTYFQSRNEIHPQMQLRDSELIVQGRMCKRAGEILKNTYELRAKLTDNILNLNVKLNVVEPATIAVAKIWFLTRWFQNIRIDGVPENIGEKTLGWTLITTKDGVQPKSVVLFDDKGSLEIQGVTDPLVFWHFYKRNKLELMYGFAKKFIQKGTYVGNFKLLYEER